MGKRIGFAVSSQSLILNGGIGQFTRAYITMAQNEGRIADLILDKPLEDTAAMNIDFKGMTFHPEAWFRYGMHQGIHRYSDSVNFEKEINFRNAFMNALTRNVYDLMICNVPETFVPRHSLGMTKYIPVIFYTHNENFVGLDEKGGPYTDEYNEIYMRMLPLATIIGTQSMQNGLRMVENGVAQGSKILVLPMPLLESGLLRPSTTPKNGVLFIGRWEERKNPKEYIELLKGLNNNIPANVITNSNGGKKFIKAFQEAGITNYNISISVASDEKVRIIKGSKYFFNPATKESFCYTMMECIDHCVCIVNSKYIWHTPFADAENYYSYKTIDQAVDIIKNHEPEPSLYAALYQSKSIDAREDVLQVLHGQRGVSAQSRFAGIKTGWVNEVNSIGRSLGVEDIYSMYNALGNYHIAQYPQGTWMYFDPKDATPPSFSTGKVNVIDELFGVSH